jgi:hypothetical protein
VPRQFSTGGKPVLGRINRQGDVYLRTLLIHGVRSALLALTRRHDKLSRWAGALIERRGFKKACVAPAAKNARVIWVRAYESVSQARAWLARFIEFYNTRRPHSSLDRKTPDEFYFASLSAMKKAARAMIAARHTGYAPPAGSRFVASDRAGRPCITLQRDQFDVS